jgi:hypothetical protein
MEEQAVNIVSIDPSLSCTGVFYHCRGRSGSYSIKLSSKIPQMRRLSMLFDAISGCPFVAQADLAIVEEHPAHAPRATLLAEPNTITRLALYRRGIPVVTIPNNTWKQELRFPAMKKGSRAADLAYIDTVYRDYGRMFDTTDEADAYLMYAAVLKILSEEAAGGKGAARVLAQYQAIMSGHAKNSIQKVEA